MVDADTDAFNKIMDAFKLPKESEQEKVDRKQAIHNATKEAIEVPLMVMRTSFEALTLLKEMAEKEILTPFQMQELVPYAVKRLFKALY